MLLSCERDTALALQLGAAQQEQQVEELNAMGERQQAIKVAVIEAERAWATTKDRLCGLHRQCLHELSFFRNPPSDLLVLGLPLALVLGYKHNVRSRDAQESRIAWDNFLRPQLRNPNSLLDRLCRFDVEEIPSRNLQTARQLVMSDEFKQAHEREAGPYHMSSSAMGSAGLFAWLHAAIQVEGAQSKCREEEISNMTKHTQRVAEWRDAWLQQLAYGE